MVGRLPHHPNQGLRKAKPASDHTPLAGLLLLSTRESFVWSYGIAALCVVLLIVGAVTFILLSFDFPDEPRP